MLGINVQGITKRIPGLTDDAGLLAESLEYATGAGQIRGMGYTMAYGHWT
jgi:hypothetical protein